MTADKAKAAEKPEVTIEELQKQLEEAQEALAAEKAKKEAPTKGPQGIKMTIKVADLKKSEGIGKFPPEGSDGKGNLIKFVKNEKDAEALAAAGWAGYTPKKKDK